MSDSPHHVELGDNSSGLSSPHSTPEPGSPSAQDQQRKKKKSRRRTKSNGNNHEESSNNTTLLSPHPLVTLNPSNANANSTTAASSASSSHPSPHPHASSIALEPLHVSGPAASASASASAPAPAAPAVALEKPPRKKPGRKPGSGNKPKPGTSTPTLAAADSSATNTGTEGAGKVRKARKARDHSAPTAARRRKNQASSEAPEGSTESGLGPATQAEFNVIAPNPTESGSNEAVPRPITSFFAPQGPQPPPPPHATHSQQPLRTSGQNYDPIRSNYDPVRENVVIHNQIHSQGSPSSNSHPSMNRASASPSISSLVDPPNQAMTSPSIAAQSFFHQQQQARLQRDEGHPSLPPSPTVNRLAPSVVVEPSSSSNPQPADIAPKPFEPTPLVAVNSSKKNIGPGSTATSSTAVSPKPFKAKEPKSKELFPTPPPLPGSGLIQLGGGGPNDATEYRAPTVIINIPMNGEVNKYVNFTRLAEEQYGWDALHPRLAAQRDRLARVAAAGAALERSGSGRDSGDDMSLDSEGEGDNSNVEMGGMSDGRTGTDGGAKKVPRKRKMKEDEYDKDDGFVDDSELLWEEQAAAANDGFFVYSGPLVPEGEKPALELRADGAPKRGRGPGSRGGRGRGSRGGATGATATGIGRNGLPASGPGSRGGLTTRKPRITKADRARMEQEKLEREKMGTIAQMPNGYGSMPTLASAANIGTTPMVFN